MGSVRFSLVGLACVFLIFGLIFVMALNLISKKFFSVDPTRGGDTKPRHTKLEL